MDSSRLRAGDAEPLRTRAIGGLMLAGGGLAAVTVALPPAATGSELGVIVAGAVAGLVGIALVARAGREWPEWILGLAVALGTALITLATHQGGPGQTGTADNEILYIWVCIFAFYFFTARHALIQLAIVGIAYSWLLTVQRLPADEAATRLVVTLSTLLLTGVLVAALRRSVFGLVGELSDRAQLDSLTGLFNRRGLGERAIDEFARSRRNGENGTPVAMLVTDIDGFKVFNDSLGHLAGDEVLRGVAETLRAATREIDTVGRLGGDEFAVLLSGADAHVAKEIAERLRTEVKRRGAESRLKLTLSIGVAVGPPDDGSLETLWSAADHAMYEAKRTGGDRVCVRTLHPPTPIRLGHLALVEP